MTKPEAEQYVLTLKAKLTPEERDRFNRLIYPASQVNALSAIIRWWMRQDDVVRRDILGMLPECGRGDFMVLVMRRLLESQDHEAGSRVAAELQQVLDSFRERR